MVVLPLALMCFKLYVLDYPLASLVPAVSYDVTVDMQLYGHGDAVRVGTYLPATGNRQEISEEANSSGPFAFTLRSERGNRIAEWSAESVDGPVSLRYSFNVQGEHLLYKIPPEISIPASYPAALSEHLMEEEGIQVGDPLVKQKVAELFPEGRKDVLGALRIIYGDLFENFANRDFSGYTDAVTALKLGEASCNGKSRLFAAIARNINIPARLVGGLILDQGTKRVSHQWVEAYVNGHWVPFDTINGYFAEIPENYLVLYYGDRYLFSHTPDINFKYLFRMKKRLVPQREVQEDLTGSLLNVVSFYSVFEKVGIPQDLLKIIMMIPLGALVTVVFRNVIGLQTFGTFLPALLAAASREAGIVWGIAGFLMIIAITYAIRRVLDAMQLLHSPKMGVMLTVVVLSMLAITVLSVRMGLMELAHVSLFPIAILAITAERFAIIDAEQGTRKAVEMMFMTLVVMSACYAVMASEFMQGLILAFPELLMVVIALNLWVGRWIGLRVSEFVRFRRLIFGQ